MKKLGIGICGSFCNHLEILKLSDTLAKDYDITFFITDNVKLNSTRFGTKEELIEKLKNISGKNVVDNLVEAEKYGPFIPLDLMLIMPCSATTLNKLYQGIYDTPVLLATKAHLRCSRPVVLAIASNDFLGLSGKNLFAMINQKNIYFVPFGQDDYINKPNSLVSHFDMTTKTLLMALEGKQFQPILKQYLKEETK